MIIGEILRLDVVQERFDYGLFFTVGSCIHPVTTILKFIAFVNQECCVSAVVDDELRA